MPSPRILRVNELLKREISELLHTDYKTESIAVTVTGVDTSPDLRNAKVSVSIFNNSEKVKTMKWLNRIRKHIRFRIGKSVHLKYIPTLTFVLDESIEKSCDILQKIDQLET